MPELPEVQVVINYLNKNILNKQIQNVEVISENAKVLKNINIKQFIDSLTGSTIKQIERNGKYLVFYLDNDLVWIVHLRMTGTFSIHPNTDVKKLKLKSTIALFYFKDFVLRFDSPRKFSTFDVIHKNEYSSFLPLGKVNYDPLSEKCNGLWFYEQIKHCNRNIKTILLDQSIISGIGNIYADEILFTCKIHPLTIANKITKPMANKMMNAAKEILTESIKHNGTTIHSFSFNGIDSGEYQNYLKIHHHKIKKCPTCKTQIEFIKVNGRGTYFCKKCQILK